VLKPEEAIPDVLDQCGPELVFGRRSGFAFWADPAGRLVLAVVRQLNTRRNDYYDGPFDQLADNYAEEPQILEWMQRAFPSLRGRIDTYGYYTDQDRPLRVALSTYFHVRGDGGHRRVRRAAGEPAGSVRIRFPGWPRAGRNRRGLIGTARGCGERCPWPRRQRRTDAGMRIAQGRPASGRDCRDRNGCWAGIGESVRPVGAQPTCLSFFRLLSSRGGSRWLPRMV
jgi:hypothetical protein